MLKVDLDTFWKKDALAHKENCFSPDAPQVALGIRMSGECVFAELGEEGNPWGYTDPIRRQQLHKRYNDKAESIVGIRLLDESDPAPSDSHFPSIRQIGEVFGGKYEFNGVSEWLNKSMDTPSELEAMLDRIERMNLRDFILPPSWDSEKVRIFEKYGKKPSAWRGVRGPVTLAMSVYGAENLIFLLMDEPELATRFSQTILRVMKGYIDIMDAEAGYTAQTRPHGFGFADDDCCLLNAEMYEAFAYPILKGIFDYVCPNPSDWRYQHSDSAMGHIIPILARFNLSACNFGPTVTVEEIRRHMPRTRIDGQLAPFTFMRNNEADIISEVRRDCEAAKKYGRGVNITTAGSINNGSLLSSMLAVMYSIQEYGQYIE
ncbi:MAG: uroporphyrinogen decarboxylase family protein [Eubacteriales bacterium]